VCFAEPRAAVDEQRVVGLCRRLGYGDGRGVREAVGWRNDERLERVRGVDQILFDASEAKPGTLVPATVPQP